MNLKIVVPLVISFCLVFGSSAYSEPKYEGHIKDSNVFNGWGKHFQELVVEIDKLASATQVQSAVTAFESEDFHEIDPLIPSYEKFREGQLEEINEILANTPPPPTPNDFVHSSEAKARELAASLKVQYEAMPELVEATVKASDEMVSLLTRLGHGNPESQTRALNQITQRLMEAEIKSLQLNNMILTSVSELNGENSLMRSGMLMAIAHNKINIEELELIIRAKKTNLIRSKRKKYYKKIAAQLEILEQMLEKTDEIAATEEENLKAALDNSETETEKQYFLDALAINQKSSKFIFFDREMYDVARSNYELLQSRDSFYKISRKLAKNRGKRRQLIASRNQMQRELYSEFDN